MSSLKIFEETEAVGDPESVVGRLCDELARRNNTQFQHCKVFVATRTGDADSAMCLMPAHAVHRREEIVEAVRGLCWQLYTGVYL